MENYYEIIMKNGLSLLIFTNEDGFCEFSINGNEFSVFSGQGVNGDKVSLSVSAARPVKPGADPMDVLIDHEFTVLSMRTLNLKNLKGMAKTEIRKGKALRNAEAESCERSLTRGRNYFFARHGYVKTPYGWLFGEG